MTSKKQLIKEIQSLDKKEMCDEIIRVGNRIFSHLHLTTNKLMRKDKGYIQNLYSSAMMLDAKTKNFKLAGDKQ